MAFFDHFIQGSFRGVPFLTENLNTRVGRRNVYHEYPFRDVPSFEDLGLKGRVYKINAYVMGNDHDIQRDKLLKAVETKGSGELLHPEYGVQTVILEGGIDIKTAPVEEKRITRFSLTFLQAGAVKYPAIRRNVLAELSSLQENIQDALTRELNQKLTGMYATDAVVEQAMTRLEALL